MDNLTCLVNTSHDDFSRTTPESTRDLVEKGFSLIPLHSIDLRGKCTCSNIDCHSPGKHPITRNGLKDASSNEKVISSWWHKYPYANTGIATGSISCLVVLDIDLKSGGFGIR